MTWHYWCGVCAQVVRERESIGGKREEADIVLDLGENWTLYKLPYIIFVILLLLIVFPVLNLIGSS